MEETVDREQKIAEIEAELSNLDHHRSQLLDELISSYSEKELEIIADVFERFTKLWEQEREKIRKDP